MEKFAGGSRDKKVIFFVLMLHFHLQDAKNEIEIKHQREEYHGQLEDFFAEKITSNAFLLDCLDSIAADYKKGLKHINIYIK